MIITMLHILLLILKIIGITLGVLLGVIILAICLLLFVPIHYSVDAERAEGEGSPPIVLVVKAAWLLHFINARILYSSELKLRLRILFFTIFRIPAKQGKSKKKSGKGKKRGNKRKAAETEKRGSKEKAEEKRSNEESAEETEKHGSEDSAAETGKHGSEDSAAETEKRGSEDSAAETENSGNEAGIAETRKNRNEIKAAETVKRVNEDSASETVKRSNKADFDKYNESGTQSGSHNNEGYTEHKLTIKEKLLKIWNFFKNIWYTIKEICGRIKAIFENIEYYLNILKSDTFKSAFSLCKDELFSIFSYIKPRKFNADIVIGTGDPASTADILSYYYGILYPLTGNHVIVAGDFDEKKLEGTVFIKGKIKLYTILKAAVRIYFNKDVKKLLKLFKKEDE